MSKNQPGLGSVYFWSDSPNYFFQTLLGETSPTPTRGNQAYGGWERVKRKRRRSLVEWTGPEPLAIDIAILLDGFAEGITQETKITQLERMAGRQRPGTPEDEPPLIHFNSGGVVPHDYHVEPSTEWVIEEIVWGDADRRGDGQRIRQAATITVCEYIEDDNLISLTSAQRRTLAQAKRSKKKGSGAKGAKKRRYTVHNGDTLESIAAHQLGSSSRWGEIKTLNPRYRDAKKPIPAGTVLVLP